VSHGERFYILFRETSHETVYDFRKLVFCVYAVCGSGRVTADSGNTGCFKKSFTNLKAYMNKLI
jgi:hypothetical protein